MELWEYNALVFGYNDRKERDSRERFAASWQTAAFSGAAMGGKLKSLKHYLRDDADPIEAPAVTEEQMRAMDGRFHALKEEGS